MQQAAVQGTSTSALQLVRFPDNDEVEDRRMPTTNWTPLRRVAEKIAAGCRSRIILWQTVGQSADATEEVVCRLIAKGFIVPLLSYRFEVTEAFGAWLENLRKSEDSPPVSPVPEQPTAESRAAGERPLVSRTRARKPYFPHLSTDRSQAVREMAARVKEVIERDGTGSMSLSAVKRALHGYRYPGVWEDGLRLLGQHRQAAITGGSISLHGLEGNALPDPYGPPPKEKKPKRKRRRSEWFERNLEKMEQGQHANFDEDWNEEDEDEEELTEEEQFRRYWQQKVEG
jgi:hypothetical protein